MQNASEQLGVFVGTMVGGTLIGSLGYRNALIGYGAIAILGSLFFFFGVTDQFNTVEKGEGNKRMSVI